MSNNVQGPLTEEEKKEVLYMLFYQNKTHTQIYDALNRRQGNEALKSFIKKIQRNYKQNKTDDYENIFGETIKRLIKQGLNKHTAIKLVTSCIDTIQDITDPKEAVDLIIEGTNFKDLLLAQTNNNKRNLSIMTESSSQKADQSRQSVTPREQDALYKIK